MLDFFKLALGTSARHSNGTAVPLRGDCMHPRTLCRCMRTVHTFAVVSM